MCADGLASFWGERGLLLVIAIKCMPVSSLGDKHDGLTALYRKNTWFANYLNSPCHFIQLLEHMIASVRGCVCHCQQRFGALLSASPLQGQISPANFFNVILMGISKLISTWWRHKNAWWVATQCEDGNIKKEKEKNCQHERQAASLSRRMTALRKPPSGERVKWDWSPDKILEVGKLITHK